MKDGLLGKDLIVTYVRDGAAPFKLETEKFNYKRIEEEQKKHPIGEPSEHVRVILKGWELDVEGEVVDPFIDDLMHEMEENHRKNRPMPTIEVRVDEVYNNGEVRKWVFRSDGGVRISGFEKTGDGGDKAIKYKFKIHAQKREMVA